MPEFVRDAGAWKSVLAEWVRDAGTWKPVTNAWVRDGGAWRQSFVSESTPPTSASALDVSTPGNPLAQINWTAGSVPGGNSVWRTRIERNDGGGFVFLANVVATATQFVDSSGICSETYTYRVRHETLAGSNPTAFATSNSVLLDNCL